MFGSHLPALWGGGADVVEAAAGQTSVSVDVPRQCGLQQWCFQMPGVRPQLHVLDLGDPSGVPSPPPSPAGPASQASGRILGSLA